MIEPILQKATVLCAMRSVDETAELIDLLDQLLGTQSRRADTIGRVKQVEIAKVAFELLSRRFLGKQTDIMGLVVRSDLKAREHHNPVRLKHLTQRIDAGHAAVVGQADYRNAQLEKLLERHLDVLRLIQSVIGSPIGPVVTDGISLERTTPGLRIGIVVAHAPAYI